MLGFFFFFLTILGKLKVIFNNRILSLKLWDFEFGILIKFGSFICNSPLTIGHLQFAPQTNFINFTVEYSKNQKILLCANRVWDIYSFSIIMGGYCLILYCLEEEYLKYIFIVNLI